MLIKGKEIKTKSTDEKPINKKIFIKGCFLAFWILVWNIISILINKEFLLASPLEVFRETVHLAFEKSFWERVLFSYIRIMTGFFLAVFLGIALASLSYKFKIVKEFLNPFISAVKATPTAAVIILFLVWAKAEYLSILISVFMALPIIYVNILKGLEEVDSNLLEMAEVFRISPLKKIIYIYISQTAPYFESGGINALGIAWKSGIAAEVIGVPHNSIGEILYYSKVYLNTASLFSWAVVIIALSYISEKIFSYMVKFFLGKIERK